MSEVEPMVSIEYSKEAIVVTLTPESILGDSEIIKLSDSIVPLVMENRGTNLVFDFNKVNYVSSSLLGFLVKLHKMVREHQGRLIVCCINKKITSSPNDRFVYEIFKVTKLDAYLDICDSVDLALQMLCENKG